MFDVFVLVVIATYLLMLASFKFAPKRLFHIPVMSSIIIFDLCVPFYLYATRDWKTRLIESGDILSFGVWMHFGLIITLYVLYIVQVQSARKLLKGEQDVRSDHRGQGIAILFVRALVIITGMMLIEPESVVPN
jgi:hypothetical protein